MATIEVCTEEHIEYLKDKLSEADCLELEYLGYSPPSDGLVKSFKNSDTTWVAIHNGNPVCVFGIASEKKWGIPWMLTAEGFYDISHQFTRECRGVIRHMKTLHPYLSNIVYSGNTKAIRWLEWCGFKMVKQINIRGHEFVTFVMRGGKNV
jgi:hypothetical protein